MQRAFTRYIVYSWSPQIQIMRGYMVHANAVAAVQPNVAPNSISLQHDLGCVLAWRYRLNALNFVLLRIYRRHL